MKTCTECGATKELVDFYKHPGCRLGRFGKCKECLLAGQRLYRKHNPVKLREYERIRSKWEHRREAQRKRGKQEHRKEANRKRQREWRKRNTIKIKAYLAVTNAIKRGDLLRGECSNCGTPNAQAHHEDYTKPLDVIWLCPICHAQEHPREKLVA